jgi:transposase-like protein
MSDTGPKTLIDAVRYFTDPQICHAYMVNLKWPDGKIVCPHCGGDKIGEIKTRRLMRCKAKGCRKQFSAKVGTIFEDSPLPLSSWFVAVWSIASAKNGISSCELARALGVRQPTAWFMLHRIRLAMKTGVRFAMRSKKKRKFWIHFTIHECPLCGRGIKYRNRRKGRKPKDYTKRYTYEQHWCGCGY